MENFLITITYLLVGMGFKRLRTFPEQTGTVLNLFVIYLSLPALVLLKIPELTFSSQILTPVLLPWILLAVSAGLVLLLCRLFAFDQPTTGCLLLMAPLGNTSFLGIPMVGAFFGEAAIPYALLYDQFGSFLALATYGSLVLAWYGSAGARPTPAGVVKKIAVFPPFLALILALLLRLVPSYPAVFLDLLRALAATLVPVVMIAVGYQLNLRLSRAVLGQMGVGLTLKLVAAPLVALGLCQALGLEGEAVRVAIFEAGMPPMVSAGALAILADLAP
ncbi:MAG TPA: AEC family transporter, partial [Desulfurivibrionaceae bacterium]|nr:AEC family transporter [Desulfurivibrionaceae bacterium]